MLGNDSTVPTADYTVGPEENSIKNKGGNRPERAPTAQNTHTERLKRGRLQPTNGGRRVE